MNVNSPLLEVKDLHVSINENAILKNLNLTINKGEIHAIMGPNGSGKSTFSKVLAGHPAYSKSILLITHYQRLLDYIKPDYVHVFQDGKIIKTGSAELAKELENKGYEWLRE